MQVQALCFCVLLFRTFCGSDDRTRGYNHVKEESLLYFEAFTSADSIVQTAVEE